MTVVHLVNAKLKGLDCKKKERKKEKQNIVLHSKRIELSLVL